MKRKLAFPFVICALVVSVNLCLAGDKSEEGSDGFWDRTKKGGKRILKGVGSAGKEVGKGFQEIFDPNDEDLEGNAKGKKKAKKAKAEDDSSDE